MGTEAVAVLIGSLLAATIRSASPIVLAAVGEIYAERSGVLNLGLDGIMMAGAFACYIGAHISGSLGVGILLGMLAGALLSLLHAVFAINLGVDQIISSLMVGYLGAAVADFLGRPLMGIQIPSLSGNETSVLTQIPVVGRAIFGQNVLVYVTLVIVVVSWFILFRSRPGLVITAVGDNPRAADSAGINVGRVRYVCVLVGGVLAGLAGAYIACVYSSVFSARLIAGRGWIAIALVVFSAYHPVRAALGGLFFGGIEALQFRMELLQVDVPYHFLMMLPYIATILVLVIAGREKLLKLLGAPLTLGRPYKRE
jgi:simple sugar transport system permease protein